MANDPEVLSNTAYCGGALVSPTQILTAGHCAGSTDDTFDVRLGAQTLDGGEQQKVDVDRVVRHPEYRLLPSSHGDQPPNMTVTSDYAVIFLKHPVDNIKPVDISRDLPVNGSDVLALGHGLSSEESDHSDNELSNIPLSFTAYGEKCENTINGYTVDPTSICGYKRDAAENDRESRGICSGDSGGPLITGNKNDPRMVGIVSATTTGKDKRCQDDTHPALFSNPVEARDWVLHDSGQAPSADKKVRFTADRTPGRTHRLQCSTDLKPGETAHVEYYEDLGGEGVAFNPVGNADSFEPLEVDDAEGNSFSCNITVSNPSGAVEYTSSAESSH
nr:trypsin-like serine protease [Corynebacterium sp. CNJ-954]